MFVYKFKPVSQAMFSCRFLTSKYREHVGERGDDVSETVGQNSRHVCQIGEENRLAKNNFLQP